MDAFTDRLQFSSQNPRGCDSISVRCRQMPGVNRAPVRSGRMYGRLSLAAAIAAGRVGVAGDRQMATAFGQWFKGI